MESLFLNSGFLAVAGALVSVPIIIHLINRMRFKRIRWAAMEFLLKAQKRKRKRLIIEQLILLMLRCLLVALVGLLVSRFIGSALANIGGKPNLRVVVLDDTLSMHDEWDDEVKEKGKRNAFDVAVHDHLLKKICPGLKTQNAADELVILPISKLVNDPDFQPKYYKYLNDESKYAEMEAEISKLEPSLQHIGMMPVIKALTALLDVRQGNNITLTFVSDMRHRDWGPDGDAWLKELGQLTQKNTDLNVKQLDAVFPLRDPKSTTVPEARDNVAILDLRPATRVVSKNMRMEFIMRLANFSAQDQMVNVQVWDEMKGEERMDVNFRGPMPVKIPAGSMDTLVPFELPPIDLKKDLPFQKGHLLISAKLMSPDNKYNPLPADGLPNDNKRYASVEVRDSVPVLIIDGRGVNTKDIVAQDWRYVDTALKAAPSADYEVKFGEDYGGGDPVRALERSDVLAQFSAVYLLNVPELKPRQLANLEAYIAAGGGVSVFLGPEVSKDHYNKTWYRDGKGFFPVELTDVITAKISGEDVKVEDRESQDLILRERLFPSLDGYPIFGPMLRDGMNRRNFENVNVSKYYRTKRRERPREEPPADGKPEVGPRTTNVLELATLTSEKTIQGDIASKIAEVFYPDEGKRNHAWNKVFANKSLEKYWIGLERYRKYIKSEMETNLGKKVYHLARPLNDLLTDPGRKIEDPKDKTKEIQDPNYPDLTELWGHADPDVQALRTKILNLYDEFAYGDPFVISSNFGKGRVILVTSTSGKRWSGWGGGSSDEPSAFPIFLEELQKYLASQGAESTYTVGTPLTLDLDAEIFKQRGIPHFKVKRVVMKPVHEKAAEVSSKQDINGKEVDGVVGFPLPMVLEPAMSVTELIDERTNQAVTSVVHVYNVDAVSEGALQRALEVNVPNARPGSIEAPRGMFETTDVVPARSDLSESPIFFLIIIMVLIAEQALAVHLSFHMKGEELALPSQAGRPRAQAA